MVFTQKKKRQKKVDSKRSLSQQFKRHETHKKKNARNKRNVQLIIILRSKLKCNLLPPAVVNQRWIVGAAAIHESVGLKTKSNL